MKITKAEADLIEAIRNVDADPEMIVENVINFKRGISDMKKYVCKDCAARLEKVLLFRKILTS